MSDTTPVSGKLSLLAAIINAIGAALSAGVISPTQAHDAATAIKADADHHAMLDRLYAERIAKAQAESQAADH